MIKKAIHQIRDRSLPKEIQERIPEKWSGNSFIPPGWRNLVRMLNKELAEVAPNYELHQVKSKFGTLRYYIDLDFVEGDETQDKVYEIIDKYEQLSAHTCEVCGQNAKTGANTFLVYTRCDKHKE